MDKMSMMRTFVALVEQGSYTAAAAQTGASKSVVSNRVQRLEEEIGVRLVNRSTRSISITETGRHYYQQCVQILEQIMAVERGLLERDVAVSGRLRVTAPQTFGVHYVVPCCSEFVRANPAVRLNIELSDKHLDLVEGGFDIGIRIGQLSDSQLIARTIGSLRVLMVAAPAYLAARGVPESAAQLRQLDCIYDSNHRGGLRWKLGNGADADSVLITPTICVNSASAVRQAALSGAGIARVFEFLVRDDLQAGRLCEILPERARYATPVQLVYAHRPLMPAKTRAFIDFMTAQMQRTLA